MSLHPWTKRSHLLSNPIPALIAAYARSSAFNILQTSLQKGELVIEDGEGIHHFGKAVPGSRSVTLTVANNNIWTRILLSHDIGLSEAYMLGDFEVSSLKDLFDLWLDNRTELAPFSNTISSLFAHYSAMAICKLGRQNLHMAKWNVEVAYDVSNDFMRCFLSKEMMYSCAIWGDEENGPCGDLTVGPTPGDLEAAQHRKIHLMLKKARVRPGHRLLEIGSGWGAMAVAAARLGCQVDTVTLSIEQKEETEQKAAAAGLTDRIRVHLCDYRNLPPSFKHAFDAFVSCEMVEAVGPSYYQYYFGMIDWALKKDKAAAVITATSQPESRYTDYQPDDFARHYHWPNCHLPSATSLAAAVQRVVPGKFVLYNLEDQGVHYPRTLREWGRRLTANFRGDVVTHIQARYPELQDPQKLEGFFKKWMYMFVYAEVGYARAYTSLNCWTFARPENVAEVCG